MNSCEKYQEYISAYIDGQLSDELTEELMQHLSICPDCAEMFETYKSLFSDGEMVQPPKELVASVMESISSLPVPDEKRSSSDKAKIRRIAGLVAAAACIAIVIYVVPVFTPKGMKSEQSTDAASVVCEEAAMVEESDECEIVESAETKEAAPEEAEEETGSENDSNSDEKSHYQKIETKYFILVDGSLPPILENVYFDEMDDGSFVTYLKMEEAKSLIDYGYTLQNTEYPSATESVVKIIYIEEE